MQTLCDEHAAEAKHDWREKGAIRIGSAPDTIPTMLCYLSELWQQEVTIDTLQSELALSVVHDVLVY